MQDYERPTSLPGALDILSQGHRQLLAGGTDVYPATKAQFLSRPVLDISAIDGLRGIVRQPDGIRIGACTTWTDVMSADLRAGLRRSENGIGGSRRRQIQNVGTVAGNICNASPAADGVPPLLILDAPN